VVRERGFWVVKTWWNVWLTWSFGWLIFVDEKYANFSNLFLGGLRGFRFWRSWDGGALVEGDLPSSIEEYP